MARRGNGRARHVATRVVYLSALSGGGWRATSMNGAQTVAELLPRIAALPSRDEMDSYRMQPARAREVRRALFRELFRSVPVAHLLPGAVGAGSEEEVLALLDRHDWSLQQTQQYAEALELAAGAKGKQVDRAEVTDGRADDVPVLQPEYSEQRRGMGCGHVFRKGEPVFRCHDCSLDDTCVQCAPCYQNSIHARENHDVVFSVSDEGGGCCDCGDEEAWKCDLGCEFHSLNPCSARERGTSAGAAASAPASFADALGSVPEERRAPLAGFAERLLFFVLGTLEHAREQTPLVMGPDVLEELKRQPSLEGLFDDAGEAMHTDLPRPMAAILWNDERHSFTQVSEKILEVLSSMSVKGSRQFAEAVDRHGREVLRISTEVRQLVRMAQRINVIDLMVTVVPAFDLFAEDVAGCVLSFLVDLARCALYVPAGAGSARSAVPDARALKLVLTSALLGAYRNPAWEEAESTMQRAFFDPTQLTRLDALLLLDTRMWKAARLDVRHLLMDLIGCREARQEVALRFAHVYPKLVETFALRDREPEHSVYHMSVQLFSVPSVAQRLLVERNYTPVLLNVLQAIFANDASGRRVPTALTLPAPPPAHAQANANSPLLRQQKCYHVFHDVRYLIGAEGVQRAIAQHGGESLGPWIDLLALFQGIAPDKRAAHTHVEFESELWIQVFHISSHLGRLAKLLGEAFRLADAAQLRAALVFAAQRVLHEMHALQRADPETHPAPVFHTALSPSGAAERVPAFRVGTQAVSFHHPMHWLLAEMLKQLHAGGAAGDVLPLSPALDEEAQLALFDVPLRVAVKLAQIRCNVWVRNGFAIRSQAYHYRDSMWMRDIMYDQDLFLLQSALAFLPPERMLAALLDRFDLGAWATAPPPGGRLPAHDVYDREQATFMAEELLLLLIVLLRETSVAAHWPMERRIERELVHFLALGPTSYSELTKQIPEHFTDHAGFDRVLAQVATFRSPDGSSDTGTYLLRPAHLEQVDPFFHHYSRNQRERAEEVLNEKRERPPVVDGAPLRLDRAARARLPELRGSPFARLVHLYEARGFRALLFRTLANAADVYEEPPDALVDAALHLLLCGLAEAPEPFAHALATEAWPRRADEQGVATDGTTLLDLVLELEAAPRFAGARATLAEVRTAAAAHDAAAAAAAERAQASAGTKRGSQEGAAPEDAKRAMARARQEAVMRQFSAQQQSLLQSLGDEEEEELEEEHDAAPAQPSTDWGTCIMCQEALHQHRAFGTLAHLQPSRVMRTTPPRQPTYVHDVLDTPLELDAGTADGQRKRGRFSRFEHGASGTRVHPALEAGGGRVALGYPSAHHATGVVAVSCGHRMHVSCFQMYVHSVEQRHALQVARNHPEDLQRYEYVCPLCKSLGNVLLPVVGASPLCAPAVQREGAAPPGAVRFDHVPLADWVRRINIAILKHSNAVPAMRPEQHPHERDDGTGCFRAFFAEATPLPAAPGEGAQFFPREESEMLLGITSVLQLISHETRAARAADHHGSLLAPGRAAPERHALADALYVPRDVVAYTLAQLEITQRGMPRSGEAAASRTVADTLTETQLGLLQSLLGLLNARVACGAAAAADGQAAAGESGADALVHGLLKRLLPHWAGESAMRSPLLLRNTLGVLVEAAVLIPQHLPHVTALLYYVTLVQVVFGLAQPSLAHVERRRGEEAGQAEDLRAAHAIFPHARWLVTSIVSLVGFVRGNITLGFDHLDDAHLAKALCSYTLPFLRRAALLHRAVNAAYAEDGLAEPPPAEAPEYVRLLHLLHIPPPTEALPPNAQHVGLMAMLLEGWTKHAYAQLWPLFRPLPIHPTEGERVPAGVPSVVLEHPHIYELLPLPADLAVLLQQTQQRTCRRCNTLPPTYSVCLFCGDMLCEQSYCCSDPDDEEARGECNQHMEQCGGQVGAHFRVGSNAVVLMYENNGMFASSPYLNSHGEVDRFLLKARPQRLSVQRYDGLRKQWLQHGIASTVARKIESSMDQGGWGTL